MNPCLFSRIKFIFVRFVFGNEKRTFAIKEKIEKTMTMLQNKKRKERKMERNCKGR